MKKIFTYAVLFATALSFAACSDDEEKFDYEAADIDYTAENAEQWANYMVTVSGLLKEDADNLLKYWTDPANGSYANSYAEIFKRHNSSEFKSAIECVEQIIDGCADIASEVGGQKIGNPYKLDKSGKKVQALYAVESWYSHHSIEDYSNNIRSIRNSFYGSTDGTVNERSLSALLEASNPTLNATAKAKIQAAIDAIEGITPPFRSHIGSEASANAMTVCGELEAFLTDELKPYFTKNISTDAVLDPVVEQYVDGVVVPTYKLLAERNTALDAAVREFKAEPSDAAFHNCATAWLKARTPWEQSEAFLFGPVDDKGLDPNMDSWPLDQHSIVRILKSQAFSNLNWREGQSDSQIEKAQSLRGYHTLEFFIFKNGEARTISQVLYTDK